MSSFAQSSKKRRAIGDPTLQDQQRRSNPSGHQRQCDDHTAVFSTPRYLSDSLRIRHSSENAEQPHVYRNFSFNILPMPADLLRLYAKKIAAVQSVSSIVVDREKEAVCRVVDESVTDEVMPVIDEMEESRFTDAAAIGNGDEPESPGREDSQQVQEDTVEALEEEQVTQEQRDKQDIAALKPLKVEVRPEQVRAPSELPARPGHQPHRTAATAPVVMRAEQLERDQAERIHAGEGAAPAEAADLVLEQDITAEEGGAVESPADETPAAAEEGSDNQADTDLASPIEGDLNDSSTEARPIPGSTTPPVSTAVVSLGPVRRAIQQRAAALPSGEITAGTEAARRAQRMREQAEQAQSENADAVAASAEEAMPPVPEDLPASLLSEENPVPGVQELLREASDRTLPDQTPPRLVRTPQNNLPVLDRSPVSPGTLRRLQNIDIETPPVGEREEGQRNQLLEIRRQLTDRLEITEGEGVLPAFVDVPPPEHPVIPEGNKVQLSQALARLLENPTGEARRMVARACGSAFVGSVLNNIEATRNLGDDTMVSEFSEVLGTQLDAIRMEAGIAAEDVDAEVQKRREQLDARREAQEQELQMSLVDERAELAEANQHVADTVAGARAAMDERAEDVQAAMGGENQRAAIEARRDRLLQDITRHVARESANYQRAGETRARELDAAERQQIAAYRFAVQQDEFQLNQNRNRIQLTEAQRERVTGGVDPVQFRIQELVAESNSWLQERLRTVRREFRTMKDAASTWTTSNRNAIQSAGENARQQIRDWASEQLGEETSWWDDLMAMIDDWLGQAEADAEAWETVQNQETAVVASGYVDMLNQVEAAANAGITEEQMLARSNLTAEERAIIHAYFNPPPGQVGRDPIGAVAVGIRERIYRQRAGELKGRLESMVLDGSFGVSGRAHVAVLEKVGQAYTPGFNAWDRATRLHAAFYPGITGLGTEEDQVFSALAGLNPVQAKAVRLAYQTEYGESLESALRSEMSSGGEINRATALLSGNQAAADAAALHMAMDETFLGTGWGTDRDVIMTTLRNKTPEQIEAIRAAYAEAYGSDISLEQKLTDELNDWATLSSHDADMAAAYMASNQECRYLVIDFGTSKSPKSTR